MAVVPTITVEIVLFTLPEIGTQALIWQQIGYFFLILHPIVFLMAFLRQQTRMRTKFGQFVKGLFSRTCRCSVCFGETGEREAVEERGDQKLAENLVPEPVRRQEE